MKETTVITKDEFIGILKDADLSEEQMVAFHRSFEKRAPGAHQQFLVNLKIGPEEIKRMRIM